jgi:hypothetical protein
MHKKKALRADYTYLIRGNVIVLVDLNLGGRSVRSDIKNILEHLRDELGELAGYAIICQDHLGLWHGIRLEQSRVIFYFLNESTLEQASNRLLHLIGD